MLVKVSILILLSIVGIESTGLQNRVVGGREARLNSIPYIVSIEYGVYYFRLPICGGTIITSTFILSAAHCVEENPLENLWVRAGIHSLLETGQLVKVVQTFVHPNYIGKVNPNDIALLRLQFDLIFGERVSPIRLPIPNSIPTGQATLSGWGSTSSTMIPSYGLDLQSVDLLIISIQECSKALLDLKGSDDPLTYTNMCTGPLYFPKKGACIGDSGGPLVTEENGENILVGVVSYGDMPCGKMGAPTVYTRVSAFEDFIFDTINPGFHFGYQDPIRNPGYHFGYLDPIRNQGCNQMQPIFY